MCNGAWGFCLKSVLADFVRLNTAVYDVLNTRFTEVLSIVYSVVFKVLCFYAFRGFVRSYKGLSEIALPVVASCKGCSLMSGVNPKP